MNDSFFDTNILLYAVSQDAAKAEITLGLLGQGGGISVQVLNEVTNVARRKMRLTWPETHALLAKFRGLLSVHPVTVETHDAGLRVSERYQMSPDDALIVAAALRADCRTLWSEDMQHGLLIDQRLRICNPFIV